MITILKQMQTKLDHIVKTTLARPSLQAVDKEELLMLTHEFPYASILQFLYTKRLQQAQDPRFGDSVTRTALFFNNPHWLNQQLRDVRPADQVRQLEETAAQPFIDEAIHDIDQEIEEPGENKTLDLSASEQALIASITEAPDGSLLQDEASILAGETAENEAVAEVVDEWERNG